MAAADYNNVVQQLYVAYFGRPADPIGLMNFTNSLNAAGAPTDMAGLTAAYSTNTTIKGLVDAFGSSAESAALYTGSTAAFVNAIFTNVLNRAPALEGLLFWANAIDSGALTRGNAAAAIMAGAQANTSTQGVIDAAVVANKTTVAANFTAALDSAAEVVAYSGSTAAQTARTMLSTVTNATDTTAFQATVTSTVDTVLTGSQTTGGTTFTLTAAANTGSDFTGTNNNDTYISTLGTNGLAANGTTLNAGDVLAGGNGTDTLNISISGTSTGAVNTSAVTLSGIERISVSNFQTDDAFDNTIDLSQATGVDRISVAASSAAGDTAFTAVRNVVTAEMGNGAGDLSITYTDDAVVGIADVQTLNLTGQTAGTFTVAGTTTGGVETLNINSATAANTIAVNDAATATITTINITGDKNLTLTEGAADPDDAVTTINASTFTGNLTVTTGSAALAVAVTGGSGNDVLTVGNFGSTDTINGGTGTDTLSIAVDVTDATLANVSNVEVLKLTGTADATLAANVATTTFDTTATTANIVTLNAGYTNATTVTMNGTGADSGDKVVNSANVALTVAISASDLVADTVTDVTITGGTGTDTLLLKAATGTAAMTNVTSVNAITIVDNGDAASGTAVKGVDVVLNLGNYATDLTIDASALDAGTVTSGTMGADDETINVDGSSVGTATVELTITGGAGYDTIKGGAGNDVLNGGAGNDSIDGGTAAGNDSILGGEGNDTINMGSALTSADTIDGGAGNDTLIVTSLSSSALANVTNVETLAFNGTATLTSNLSFTTLDLTNGASTDVVTLSTGYSNATTASVDAGDKVVNTANVTLTVNATAGDLEAADNTTITGGSGNDTLSITADGSTVGFAGLITAVDAITIVDGGDDAATGTNPAGDDITLTLGAYATAMRIDASALDAGTLASNGSMNADYENLSVSGASATKNLTVIGGSGADTITGGAGNDSITGGAGNDSITGTSGNDYIDAGTGADTVVMAAGLTYQDTLVGGDGSDTLSVTTAVDVNFMNVSGFETLTLGGAATLSTYFQATGITTVNLHTTAAAVDGAGTTVGVTYVATAAVNDTITGGTGNDTFKFGATGTLDASDSIVGGTGTDTVALNNNVDAGVTAVVDLAKVTGVENYTLLDANGDDTTVAEADAVSLSFASLASNGTDDTDVVSTISGAVITDSLDVFTVDASAVLDTDYRFAITGGAANDVLTGAAGVDTISGGEGNDVITGGAGADSLTGNAGSDVFAYTTSASTIAAADTITDFVTGTDKVQVTFTMTGTTFDATNKGASASNADALALLSSKVGQYYFNTTTGQMIMDTDGNGLIQSTDFAVNLTGLTSIGSGDVNVAVTGTGGADTITTGGGADTVTGGAGADVMTGGSGADSFVINMAADSGGTWAAADTIVDFVTTVDSINVSTVVGSGTNYAEADGAAMANEAAVLAAARAALDGTVLYYVAYNVNGAGDGYLVYDVDGADTGEVVIKLSGINLDSEFAFGDIV